MGTCYSNLPKKSVGKTCNLKIKMAQFRFHLMFLFLQHRIPVRSKQTEPKHNVFKSHLLQWCQKASSYMRQKGIYNSIEYLNVLEFKTRKMDYKNRIPVRSKQTEPNHNVFKSHLLQWRQKASSYMRQKGIYKSIEYFNVLEFKTRKMDYNTGSL